MSGISVLRGFRMKKRSKHDRDMNDALKIDRTNTDRLDRILRHLDDPDPTGALFGIKADHSWTDFVDEEMESAIREGQMTTFSMAIVSIPISNTFVKKYSSYIPSQIAIDPWKTFVATTTTGDPRC